MTRILVASSAVLWAVFFAVGCGPKVELLRYQPLGSAAMGREMEFSILEAPKPLRSEKTPVIFFLHGMGDDPRSLDRFELSQTLEGKMLSGNLPAAHMVMPQGDRGFWWNWDDGSRLYEDHVIREVIPAAEKILGVDADRERRHLMGVSMGGSGALHMGLRHPDTFASISVFSGMLMNREHAERFTKESFLRHFVDFRQIFGDASDPDHNAKHDPYIITASRAPDLGQRLFIAAGDDEEEAIMMTTRTFHEHLEKLGIDHRYEIYEGGHGWRYWEPVIHQAIRYSLK